ncbi:class I SAM-dependent methyltransferase [Streptomyces tropicalis]|uniref:Methyltransferase domain-containing protein n=1 Tax=Streptomyces tropicalis TaxID=3034234 RepID=A0ABT6ACE8_9ACTN|nr:methyltransferase domain-containing protein [Streptomyces tropicalis]MDF3302319.1 methyltransferase domain-containing protein [Streptomyces tropicalis]
MADASGFPLGGSAPERYEQYVAPIVAPFVTALVDAVDLYPGAAVLDLACGTGFAARAAAARVGPSGRVFGTDPDAGRLKVAEALHPRLYPDIEFTVAPADGLPYPDAGFDAVLCLQGAQLFPGLDAALAEAARVTRPGGRFAATVWADRSRSPYFEAQYEVLREYGGPDVAEDFARTLARTAEHLTGALTAAGFHDTVSREITFGITLPPLEGFSRGRLSVVPWGQGIVETRGEEALAEAGRALAARLADRTAPDGTATLPFSAILTTAVR